MLRQNINFENLNYIISLGLVSKHNDTYLSLLSVSLKNT